MRLQYRELGLNGCFKQSRSQQKRMNTHPDNFIFSRKEIGNRVRATKTNAQCIFQHVDHRLGANFYRFLISGTEHAHARLAYQQKKIAFFYYISYNIGADYQKIKILRFRCIRTYLGLSSYKFVYFYMQQRLPLHAYIHKETNK